MGTVAVPSYATIYTDKLKNLYVYLEIKNGGFFFKLNIDDLFIIHTSREAKLNNFLLNLNMMHDSIKFDHKNSAQSITCLDTLVYIGKDRQL